MGLLVYSQVVWLDVSIAGMTGESNRAYVQRRAGDDMPQLQAFTFSSFEPEPILHDATANMDGSFELEGSGQASSEVIYPTGSHPFVDEGSDWKKGQIIENAEVKPTRIVALRFPSIGLEQGTRVITAPTARARGSAHTTPPASFLLDRSAQLRYSHRAARAPF